MTQEAKQTPTFAIDDSLVEGYLNENPDFFDRHPQLVKQLKVTHSAKGAVSLVERQQQLLRERIAELEEEITELMGNARRNEEIFRHYSELYKRLLHTRSFAEFVQALQHSFQKQLLLPALTLKMYQAAPGLTDEYVVTADTHKQLLSKRFQHSAIYLGRLTAAEQRLLFPAPAPHEQIESVALLLLGQTGNELGILAIGSHDASHFEPAMDPLLVSQLQVLISHLLPAWLAAEHATLD